MLRTLNMVTISAGKEGPQVLTLTDNFSSSLRLALTGGGNHQSFGVPSSDRADGIDTKFLDEYARAQWEGILHYVVNSVGAAMHQEGQGPTQAVKQLLEAGNLVTRGRHTGEGITQAGFSFLLQEANAQVWTLLLLWIENAEKVCYFLGEEGHIANLDRWEWTRSRCCPSCLCLALSNWVAHITPPLSIRPSGKC